MMREMFSLSMNHLHFLSFTAAADLSQPQRPTESPQPDSRGGIGFRVVLIGFIIITALALHFLLIFCCSQRPHQNLFIRAWIADKKHWCSMQDMCIMLLLWWGCSRSLTYEGARPHKALNVGTRTLNWILNLTGSHWKEITSDVVSWKNSTVQG